MKTQGLTKAIRQILSDGEWHSMRELSNQTYDLVPPEVAVRAYGNVNGWPLRKSLTWAHVKGARMVVKRALMPLVKRGEAQVGRDGKGKIVSVKLGDGGDGSL